MTTLPVDTASMDTEAVWAGEHGPFPYGAAVVPVVRSATFAYRDTAEWQSVALGERPGFVYSRNSNPTLAVLEDKIARLDHTEAAVAFSTGMAAINAVFFALLAPGSRIVSIKDTYGGTNVLFNEFLPRFGIEVSICDTTDADSIAREIARGCAMLYLETPTNPTLKVVDIARLAQAAHAVGAVVVTDNTFATPVNQSPAALGSDLVVYSATKFLAGHSDVLAGIVSGRRELIERIYHYREIAGATLHADAAYDVLRGLKTLALRMARHNENALAVASFLETHPEVMGVYYPGLASHPSHATARAQMRGFGGVLSFVPRGDFARLRRVLEALRYAQLAAHLGGVMTTAGPPALTSHVELTPEERARAGIPETLVRYSVGIEAAADLIADLDRALRVG